jgi:hypothetical protein
LDFQKNLFCKLWFGSGITFKYFTTAFVNNLLIFIFFVVLSFPCYLKNLARVNQVIFFVAQNFVPKKVLRKLVRGTFWKFSQNRGKKVLKSSRFLGDSGRFLAFFFEIAIFTNRF